MSHPVSAYFHVAHGVANAILLPTIVEYNALADHGRYEKIYNYISKEKDPVIDFVPEMLVDEARDLLRDLGIPQHLADVGVTEDKIGCRCHEERKYHGKSETVYDQGYH